MDQRAELGEFLRLRRAAIKPGDVGLPDHGRRRVPGLRRVELSLLAGVSVEHYTRIEQGRGVRASAQVLDAIADVLRLGDNERAHVYDLANPSGLGRRRSRRPQAVRRGVRRLLDQLHEHPAYVLGRRMDILAWNPLASALVGDLATVPIGQRNVPRLVFLDEATMALYPDWERVAREVVAFLRRDTARDLEDPQLAELVRDLSLKSEPFRRWWNSHEVEAKTSGTRRFAHPGVGELELEYETLLLAADGDQALVVYSAEPGSPSHAGLRLLQTLITNNSTSKSQAPQGPVLGFMPTGSSPGVGPIDGQAPSG
jgi:transcriptional regulator with XRE-family HTH domain